MLSVTPPARMCQEPTGWPQNERTRFFVEPYGAVVEGELQGLSESLSTVASITPPRYPACSLSVMVLIYGAFPAPFEPEIHYSLCGSRRPVAVP